MPEPWLERTKFAQDLVDSKRQENWKVEHETPMVTLMCGIFASTCDHVEFGKIR